MQVSLSSVLTTERNGVEWRSRLHKRDDKRRDALIVGVANRDIDDDDVIMRITTSERRTIGRSWLNTIGRSWTTAVGGILLQDFLSIDSGCHQ